MLPQQPTPAGTLNVPIAQYQHSTNLPTTAYPTHQLPPFSTAFHQSFSHAPAHHTIHHVIPATTWQPYAFVPRDPSQTSPTSPISSPPLQVPLIPDSIPVQYIHTPHPDQPPSHHPPAPAVTATADRLSEHSGVQIVSNNRNTATHCLPYLNIPESTSSYTPVVTPPPQPQPMHFPLPQPQPMQTQSTQSQLKQTHSMHSQPMQAQSTHSHPEPTQAMRSQPAQPQSNQSQPPDPQLYLKTKANPQKPKKPRQTQRKKRTPPPKRARSNAKPPKMSLSNPSVMSSLPISSLPTPPLPALNSAHDTDSVVPQTQLSAKANGAIPRSAVNPANVATTQETKIPLENGVSSSVITNNQAMTFAAPEPRSAAPGLNFAEVMLDAPASQKDADIARYNAYRQALTARQRVASGRGDTIMRKTLPANSAAAPLAEQVTNMNSQHAPNQLNQSAKPSAPKRKYKRPPRQQKPTRKVASGAPSATGAVQECQVVAEGGQEGAQDTSSLLHNQRAVRNFGRSPHDVNSASNSSVRPLSDSHGEAAHECPVTELIEATDGGKLRNQNDLEAECLATLTDMMMVPQISDLETGQAENQRQDSQNAGRHEAEREDAGIGRRLNSNVEAHLKSTERQNAGSNSRMQNRETRNNSANFVSQQHHIYSSSIPELPPTSLAETGPSARCDTRLPSSANMDVRNAAQPENAKATPVGIRDTGNLFTRHTSQALPGVSRTHSLSREPDSAYFQNCTSPDHVQGRAVPCQPDPSPTGADSMYPSSQLVRPLFHASSPVKSTMVPQNQINSPMLPQSVACMYPLRTQSNLPSPQYQTQAGHLQQTERHQPMAQTLQPTIQLPQQSMLQFSQPAKPQPSQPPSQHLHRSEIPPKPLRQPSQQPSQQPLQQPLQQLQRPSQQLQRPAQQRSEVPPQPLQHRPQRPSQQPPQLLQQSLKQPSPLSQPSPHPAQQRESPGQPNDAPETGRISKPRKQPAKKRTARKPSDPLKTVKATEPKAKRAIKNAAKPKRARAPKKAQSASSPPIIRVPDAAPGSATRVASETASGSLPPLSASNSHSVIPSLALPMESNLLSSGLRLRGNLGLHGTALPSQVPGMPPRGETLGQSQLYHKSQLEPARVQRNPSMQRHLHLQRIRHCGIPPHIISEDCNVTSEGSPGGGSSKMAPSHIPKQRKACPKKTGDVIKKAHNAAEKAAQEGREMLPSLVGANERLATPPATPQITLRLHGPTEREALQAATVPDTAQLMLSSLERLNCSQETIGSRSAQAAAGSYPSLDPVRNLTFTARQGSEGTPIPATISRSAHAPAKSIGQGQVAFSPRTESTEQSLPLDTSSLSHSEVEYPFDADDDVPLSQAGDRARSSSGANPLSGTEQPAAKPTGSIPQQQVGNYGVSQQGSAMAGTGKQSTVVRAGSTHIENPLPSAHGTPPNLAKRKKSPKNSAPTKRRKKDQYNNSEQESSTNKQHAGTNKRTAIVIEDETQNEVSQEHLREAGVVPSRIPSPNKLQSKGQSKSKKAQHAKPARKRVSTGNKAQRKGKPNQPKSSPPCPPSEGSSGLRLCLSMQKHDGAQSSATVTDPDTDSCHSPVTVEKDSNDHKRTSRSPQLKGKRKQKQTAQIDTSVVDAKTQVVPCFAEELKNLRTSGILTTVESSPDRSLVGNHSFRGVLGIQSVACTLCQQRSSRDDMVKHPCFPVRVFDICKPCSDIVSKRVEENGAKRKSAELFSEKAITEQTTLFVMLIEEMVRHFSPSDREQRDVQRIHEFISNRDWSEMVERANSLSIDFNMLTVLRVMLRKVGFSLRGGKLRWPGGEFTLPSSADTRALVSNAIPARIDDLRKGILPGEAAWDETFPEKEKLKTQHAACAMYEKIFGLIGLRLVHVGECCSRDSSRTSCEVKFESVSLGALMYRTAAMLSGTVTQELLAKCWTKEEALRFINEVESERVNERFQGAGESCCVCGGSGKHLEGSATLRFSNCTDCLKSFCSICLLNVLGTSEYLRSFEDDGYCCMLCRLHKNAELISGGRTNLETDRRFRLRENTGMKKGAERRIKALSPLLLLSQNVRTDVLMRSDLPTSRKSLGFAMFCEAINENSVRSGINPQSDQSLHDICLECKLPAGDKKLEGEEEESLRCGHGTCANVMHKACIAPQRQIRRRGSRKWCCPHHQCSKCGQHDESKLLRCRTCPATYCKEHMPLPSEVYVFSEKYFACSKCRSSLRIPQPLRLKLHSSKSERKRNVIAQALAIDQRKRSAAVKKLSEGPRCFESKAFNELGITT